MTATVLLPLGVSASWAVGSIAITLALWVLIAHWRSPKATASAVSMLVALTLIYFPDPCAQYPPWSLPWILAGCMWP